MQLSRPEVDRHLATLRAIGAVHRLTDLHVHPFEVLLGSIRYAPNPLHDGIWSSAEIPYLPPASSTFDLDSRPGREDHLPEALRERMVLLSLRRLYLHTGPQCFRDQLSLGGVSRALLLPVPPPGVHPEGAMNAMVSMFGGDDRFHFGYSVPDGLDEGAIKADLARALNRWPIQAIKVHPDLGMLDLAAATARRRLETIVEAGSDLRLPVIVHGGASPLPGGDGGAALPEKLAAVDFGGGQAPVVIAHAGIFGLPVEDVRQRALPVMLKLLERYDHLLLDLSALPANALFEVLARVPAERLLFGSDALYDLPWKALVRLLSVLEATHCGRAEELLIQIAGRNPDRLLARGERIDDRAATHQVSPVS